MNLPFYPDKRYTCIRGSWKIRKYSESTSNCDTPFLSLLYFLSISVNQPIHQDIANLPAMPTPFLKFDFWLFSLGYFGVSTIPAGSIKSTIQLPQHTHIFFWADENIYSMRELKARGGENSRQDSGLWFMYLQYNLIAKLSPSSRSSWTELALVSLFLSSDQTRPNPTWPTRKSIKITR